MTTTGSNAKAPAPAKAPAKTPAKTPAKAPAKNNNNKAAANKSAKMYGASGGYKGVNVRSVKKQAQAEIRPQIVDLRGQNQAAKLQSQEDSEKRQQQYNNQVADLNNIYGASDAEIGKRTQNINDTYNQAAKQNSAAAAALQQMILQNSQNLGSQTGNELSQLGIGGSMNLGQMNSDTNNAVNVAAINGQNSAANLGLMQSGAVSVGDLLRSQNAGAKSSALGNALNSMNSDLSDINNDYRLQHRDIMNDIHTARAQKPSIVNQMLQQMAQTGWQQYMDRANLALQKRQVNYYTGKKANSQGYYRSSGGYSKSYSSSGSTGSSSSGKSNGSYAGLLKDLVD